MGSGRVTGRKSKGSRGRRGRKEKPPPPPPAKYAAVYYDVNHPSGYTGSAAKLARAVPGSTVARARWWMSSQDTFTLYKYARKRFTHAQIYVEGMDHQWAADLIDVQSLADDNGGLKYLLTVIDTLSKHAWVTPLPNKTAATVADALEDIFTRGRVPKRLRTDRGKEFLGGPVQSLLKAHNITFFTADNYTKEAVVERFNKSLRARLWRYFHATNTRRYADVLQNIVRAYNGSKHSSIGMAPADVDYKNQHKAWTKLYGHMLAPRKKKKGKITTGLEQGDRVRISKEKHTFEQGYKTNWSREIFVIDKVIVLPAGGGFKYKLVDTRGEEVLGSFQKEELQKVRIVPWEVHSVAKRTARGKHVTWRGLPRTLTTFLPNHSAGGAGVGRNIPSTR